MKKEAWEAGQRRRTIKAVARNGVADRGKMHADLMCASGVDLDFEQREFREPAQNAVIGKSGAPATGARGHADTACRIAFDGRIDAAPIAARRSVDEREVHFLDFARGPLRGEVAVRGIVERDQEDSTGVFVEAVDDAGAQRSTDAGEHGETME